MTTRLPRTMLARATALAATITLLSTAVNAQYVDCVHGNEVLFEDCNCSTDEDGQYAVEPVLFSEAEASCTGGTHATEVSYAASLWGGGEPEYHDPCCVCNCCPPCRWKVRAEGLFLDRSGAGDPQGLVFGPPHLFGGPQLLDVQQLDPDFRGGPRIGITRCLTECSALEFVYFGIDAWNAQAQLAGDISVQFPSFTHPPLGIPPNINNPPLFGVASFSYGSDLYSFELNLLRRRCANSWLTFVLGARYIELGEDFNVRFDTGGGTSRYAITANNRLIGFQVGGNAHVLRRGRWTVDGWLKAGVYANSANQTTFEDGAAIGAGTATVAANGDQTSFLGEVGVTARYQISCWLAVRGGYQAMWLERVALAPDQLDNVNPAMGLATIDMTGGVFLHGGFFGLEGTF